MERLNVFYKAYNSFKTIIEEDSETGRFRKFCQSLSQKKYEDLTVSFSEIKVEDDWVNAIEKGLTYVEKAIKEERQFIRNNGDVLPIEKIRRTSKASIQDLAKHSNYISHAAPADAATDVIPDKMLEIQKESDYAVYENRMLYAMLIYLKEFISVRLEKIKKLATSFEFTSFSDKKIEFGDKKIEYKLSIHELRENDPTMVMKSSAAEAIKRLDTCLTYVISYLKTPLMVEVSKVEMIKRPIIKTNVLRMNTNFRESLALYDYIAEYQGLGYEVKKVEKSFNPFSKDHSYSMTDILALTSFLTYMYANNLSDELKENFRKEKEEEAIREQERILKALHAFELKGKASMQTIEEYFEAFVKGYKIIEKKCEAYEEKIVQQQNEFLLKMAEQKEAFDKKLIEVNETHEKEVEAIHEDYKKQLDDKDEEYLSRIDDINEKHRVELNYEAEKRAKEVKEAVDPLKAQISTLTEEHESMSKELSATRKINKELEARIFAFETVSGEAPETSKMVFKDEFDKLETLKENFDAYFAAAWKAAKANIRKNNLKIDKDYKKHRQEAKEAEEAAKQAEEAAKLAEQNVEPVDEIAQSLDVPVTDEVEEKEENVNEVE